MILGVNGEQQSGKTLIFLILGMMLGNRHFIHLHSMRDMFGEFSSCVCNKCFVFLDECIWAGNNQDRNELKNKATADTERDRPMYAPTKYQESFTNYGITSNEEWFLPVEDSDRRYFALLSELFQLLNHSLYKKMFTNPDPKERINDYYTALTSSLFDLNDKGIPEGLYTFANLLYNLPLSEFDTRKIPSTELLARQKVHSFKPIQNWWLNCLSRGYIVSEFNSSTGTTPVGNWKRCISLEQLYNSYMSSKNQSSGMHGHRGNSQTYLNFWNEFQPYLPDSVIATRTEVLESNVEAKIDNNNVEDLTMNVQSMFPPDEEPIDMQMAPPPKQTPNSSKYFVNFILPTLAECKEYFAKKVPGIEYFWSPRSQQQDPTIAAFSKRVPVDRLRGVSEQQLATFAWAPEKLFGKTPLRAQLATGMFIVRNSAQVKEQDDTETRGFNDSRKKEVLKKVTSVVNPLRQADKLLNHNPDKMDVS